MRSSSHSPPVSVRALHRDELDEADRILRLAFGTFLGLSDPMAFMGDGDYVRARFAADPGLAFAAELDGELVGTNFLTCWGRVGFLGPLSVAPSRWSRGVATALLEQGLPVLSRRGVEHQGLFTFAESPRHVGLYQRFGFLPGYLTAILARPVPEAGADVTTLSGFADRAGALAATRAITGSLCPGLDLTGEISAVAAQGLGDTVLVAEDGKVVAFAVCHVGPGSEAGTGTCHLKFGAARSGPGADRRFARLVAACEVFAGNRGATRITAGVGTGRRGAYAHLLGRGYRLVRTGVAMHRPDAAPYHDENAFAIDDWR